jgi:hypothetical protein
MCTILFLLAGALYHSLSSNLLLFLYIFSSFWVWRHSKICPTLANHYSTIGLRLSLPFGNSFCLWV